MKWNKVIKSKVLGKIILCAVRSQKKANNIWKFAISATNDSFVCMWAPVMLH